jgi:hypothetical protein
MRIRISAVMRRMADRPPGYVDTVLRAGRVDGDWLVLDDAVYAELKERFGKFPAAPTPSEMAANFAGAMARWAAAGFKTMDEGGYNARLAVCIGCEMWDAAGNFGLGQCQSPGCGCTKFKLWLASETCPEKKWSC